MPLSLLISVNRTAKVNRLPLSPPLESTMDVFKTMQLAKSERKKRRLIRERQKKEKQALSPPLESTMDVFNQFS